MRHKRRIVCLRLRGESLRRLHHHPAMQGMSEIGSETEILFSKQPLHKLSSASQYKKASLEGPLNQLERNRRKSVFMHFYLHSGKIKLARAMATWLCRACFSFSSNSISDNVQKRNRPDLFRISQHCGTCPCSPSKS